MRYRPVAAERAEMDYWLVPARPGGAPSTVTPDLLFTMARRAMMVFNEDVAATEVAQRALAAKARCAGAA